ncbi:MAG: thymidine phosphorylase [Acidimicrobiia bacterium]|nr:MAG: thymidine phosphorylase [Acidimicrobiia bacterium]
MVDEGERLEEVSTRDGPRVGRLSPYAAAVNVVELIQRKRDGGRLTADEIRGLIQAYADDHVPRYQMAAMAMAIFFTGLSADELGVWTDAMMRSGEVLDLSDHPLPRADKHSTGGVGDKISIPLAPMVAACGVAIPMMSGRGLGHTGGTLDKLETIPGFTTTLDPPDFVRILGETNLVLAGQSETLVPADRRLYALRDVTATVESVPLISSSIMSKKLAEDLDALVLDVKFGTGAFMQEFEDAQLLARTMLGIGDAHGTKVSAFLTDMSQPLGREVGNANEIRESLEVLAGGGPTDVVDLTYALGTEMLLLAGAARDEEEARDRLATAVANGAAMDVFRRVVAAQGGDTKVLDDPSLLPVAANSHTVTAASDGVVVEANARRIGVAGMRLGAGRATIEDVIDPGVGITLHAKRGDRVRQGDAVAEVAWSDPARLEDCLALLESAWVIGPEATPPPLIRERLRNDHASRQ